MKKLMFAAAVALSATVGFCVESANIVGYANSDTMKAGQWYIMGLNFENIGADQSFKIKDLFAPEKFTVGALVAGTSTEDSTQIQIRDAEGNAVTYYYDQAADLDDMWNDVPGWMRVGKGGITEDSFVVGTGFWFKQPTGGGDVALNFAGQVKAADGVIAVSPIWQLAANPFPTVLKVKDLASDQLTAGTSTEDSTQIQIRDAEGNAITYYYDQAADLDDMWNDVPGWMRVGKGGITEDTIGIGVGFWVKDPSKTFNISVTR